jgi:hypothetical protein
MALSLDGTTGISASGNIVGNNISVVGSLSVGSFSPSTVSASGNITGGNLLTGGLISATGNITGAYILGNGSQLTGVDATQIINGTSNAKVVSSGGNIAVGIGGTSNVAVFATTGLFVTGAVSASGNITGLNINSANADLAEMYVADENYAPGTVVEFGGQFEITATTQSHGSRVAGVVSTAPSYLMNTNQAGEHVLPVALTGRVPCLVVGPISKGDCLVASVVKGTAQALDPDLYRPACIIGKALQDYSSDQAGTIEIAVGRT